MEHVKIKQEKVDNGYVKLEQNLDVVDMDLGTPENLCKICNTYMYFEEPQLLPCSHTFCKPCVEKGAEYIGGKQVFTCPDCSQQAPVSNKGEVIPPNKTEISLMEMVRDLSQWADSEELVDNPQIKAKAPGPVQTSITSDKPPLKEVPIKSSFNVPPSSSNGTPKQHQARSLSDVQSSFTSSNAPEQNHASKPNAYVKPMAHNHGHPMGPQQSYVEETMVHTKENRQQATGHVCNICLLNNKYVAALHVCTKCSDFLCTECADKHTYSRFTYSHTVIRLTGTTANNMANVRCQSKRFCKTHEHKLLSYFCNKCQCMVCEMCAESQHGSHKCIQMTSIGGLGVKNEEFLCLLSGVRNKMAEIRKDMKQNSEFIQKYDKRREELLENLKHEISILRQKLNICERSCSSMLYEEFARLKCIGVEENIESDKVLTCLQELYTWSESLTLMKERSKDEVLPIDGPLLDSIIDLLSINTTMTMNQFQSTRPPFVEYTSALQMAQNDCLMVVHTANDICENMCHPINGSSFTGNNRNQLANQVDVQPIDPLSRVTRNSQLVDEDKQTINSYDSREILSGNQCSKRRMNSDVTMTKRIKLEDNKENNWTDINTEEREKEKLEKHFTKQNTPLEDVTKEKQPITISGDVTEGKQPIAISADVIKGKQPITISADVTGGKQPITISADVESNMHIGPFEDNHKVQQTSKHNVNIFDAKYMKSEHEQIAKSNEAKLKVQNKELLQSTKKEQITNQNIDMSPVSHCKDDPQSVLESNGKKVSNTSVDSVAGDQPFSPEKITLNPQWRLNVRTSTDSKVPRLEGIAVTGEGLIAVNDMANKKVKVFSKTGQLMQQIRPQKDVKCGPVYVDGYLAWCTYKKLVFCPIDTGLFGGMQHYSLLRNSNKHVVPLITKIDNMLAVTYGDFHTLYGRETVEEDHKTVNKWKEVSNHTCRSISYANFLPKSVCWLGSTVLAYSSLSDSRVMVRDYTDNKVLGIYDDNRNKLFRPCGLTCDKEKDLVFVADQCKNRLVALNKRMMYQQEWLTTPAVKLPKVLHCHNNCLYMTGDDQYLNVYQYM